VACDLTGAHPLRHCHRIWRSAHLQHHGHVQLRCCRPRGNSAYPSIQYWARWRIRIFSQPLHADAGHRRVSKKWQPWPTRPRCRRGRQVYASPAGTFVSFPGLAASALCRPANAGPWSSAAGVDLAVE